LLLESSTVFEIFVFDVSVSGISVFEVSVDESKKLPKR
jgi:hypothetical protein